MDQNDIVMQLVNVAKLLIGDNSLTSDSIKKYIENSSKSLELFGKSPTQDDIDQAIRELESQMEISMDLGVYISDDEYHQSWFDPGNYSLLYWNDYENFLMQRKNFPNDTINSMDVVSSAIVNLLGDPSSTKPFARKGLVIGDVQSGKTSNYLSVMTKAADTGYQYFILLAGTMKNLRSQTQERIDEGFLGFNSSSQIGLKRKSTVGVGSMNPKRKAPNSLTTREKDFSKAIADQLIGLSGSSSNVPFVFVIQKNSRTIKNLINWLENATTTNERFELPLLLIDDEADFASINTKPGDDEPTAINNGIRSLLSLFPRSTYLSYTATPFANVFIQPNTREEMENQDLFPKDFIYVLDPPSNYIGPNRIYHPEGDYNHTLVPIDDIQDHLPIKHQKTDHLHGLPKSLRLSLDLFFLSNAIRELRKETNKHRSMIVNITRFTDVQIQISKVIEDYVNNLKRELKYLSNNSRSSLNLKNHFEELIQTHYSLELDNFIEIYNLLYTANANVIVSPINSKYKAEQILNYRANEAIGLKIIAVGGFMISRGLTFEGLSISYFYRNSKYYDTLMQMARWFGYRKNYEDLCRIFMMEDAIEWYQYINDSASELKNEVRVMRAKGLTPKDFGLRVLNSHEVLEITAPNKLRHSREVKTVVSLSATVIESPRLKNNSDINSQNLQATDQLFNLLNQKYINVGHKKQNIDKPSPFFQNIDRSLIIDYLEHFVPHESNLINATSDIVKFINSLDELMQWDIYFVEGNGSNRSIGNDYITKSSRSYKLKEDTIVQISGQRNRLGFAGSTKAGLSKNQINEIEENWKYNRKNKNNVGVSERTYLIGIKRNPMLMIYYLDLIHSIKSKDAEYDETVGIALAFPDLDGIVEYDKTTMSYKLNQKAYEEHQLGTYDWEDED